MRKKILAFALSAVVAMSFTGCASFNTAMNDLKSDMYGGFQRVIRVYTLSGDLIAEYEGKIYIVSDSDSGYIKFDFDGKRYIYYNCSVETIAELK